MHFYAPKNEYGAELLPSITTFPQARKHEKETGEPCFKSITSTLKFMPQTPCKTKHGYGMWLEWSMWRLGSEGKSFADANEQKYGLRKCPITWKMVTSSEFGTNGHKALEDWSIAWRDGRIGHHKWNEYAPWVREWEGWVINNGVEPLHTEKQLADAKRKIAGTVDFIGEITGEVFIADFKFRDLKMQAYDKDGIQLVWAADVVASWLGLDYLPDTYSVVFDSGSPQMTVKKWSDKMRKKHLRQLDVLNTFVNEWNEL